MKLNSIEAANKEILKNIVAKNPEKYSNAINIFSNKIVFNQKMTNLKSLGLGYYDITKDVFESTAKSIKSEHKSEEEFLKILRNIEMCCKYFLIF